MILNSYNQHPNPDPIYNMLNPVQLKYLTCLHLVLIHLNDYKFNLNFQDCINPLYSCSVEPASVAQLFLDCHHYSALRTEYMNELRSINKNILSLYDENSLW